MCAHAARGPWTGSAQCSVTTWSTYGPVGLSLTARREHLMEADMDLETQLGQAMRSVAESVRPPVEDLVRGGVQRGAALRHRRARYGVALAGGVGVGAAAIVAFGPRLAPGTGTPLPGGSSSSSPSAPVACGTSVETGPLPDWASAG